MDFIKNLFGYADSRFYYLSLIKEESGWSIHGLWPQYNKSSYPSFCKKVTFNIETLKPIIDRLNAIWYSIEEPNQDFWKHEWEKHGSCMFQELNELQYFQKTIDLYKFCIENDIINNYAKDNKAMIPFDLNFKLITN